MSDADFVEIFGGVATVIRARHDNAAFSVVTTAGECINLMHLPPTGEILKVIGTNNSETFAVTDGECTFILSFLCKPWRWQLYEVDFYVHFVSCRNVPSRLSSYLPNSPSGRRIGAFDWDPASETWRNDLLDVVYPDCVVYDISDRFTAFR